MMTKIIIIGYVLPLIFSSILVYKISKDNKSTIKELIPGLGFCLIPVLNIPIFLILLFLLIRDFLRDNEKFQNFLNKKL